MRRALGLLVFLVSVLVFALSPSVHAQNAPDARVIRLGTVDGDVQVQHAAQQGVQQGWEPALANMPLQQGDTLATGTGVAEIEFENGATGYLGDNSALEFTELGLTNNGSNNGLNSGLITRLSINQGSARFFVHVDDGDIFEVRSGGVSVSPRERADFRVDSYSDGISVSVFKGAASVVTPQAPAGSQTTVVEQDHMLSFHSDTQAVEVNELPAVDEFDAYVAYNNAIMMENQANQLNYTAPGAPYTYDYALSELTRYGTWFNFPGYGWVWQPTVVNPEWVPFSNGIWRFAPHFGFCFISFDRWGWLPFHFGSWIHGAQGWAWVPGSFRQWQPAVVGWVRVGNQVGWVPRAPGDQPNKLPLNVKYGVVTNPVESTTSVLRGPNQVLRSEEVKSARIISGPANSLVASTMAKSGAPFVVQPPVNRTPPFTAQVASRRPSVAGGGAGVAYDQATHAYVNSPSAVPRVGVPVGGAAVNRTPVNGIRPNGVNGPTNGVFHPMPPVPGVPQSPMMRGNAGVRFPVGQPRVVSPMSQPQPMPRPMPPAMPAPLHAQPAPRAPASLPVSGAHPGGHPAGSGNSSGSAGAAGTAHR